MYVQVVCDSISGQNQKKNVYKFMCNFYIDKDNRGNNF